MKYILVFWLILIHFASFGQTKSESEITVNDTALLAFLDVRIINNFHSRLENVGEWGTCWLKINVTEKDSVSTVFVSPAVNRTFAMFLIETLKDENNHWNFPTQYGEFERRVLVIPLWYDLQKNGRAVKAENTSDELISFLTDNSSKPQRIILFPKLEYISPFY